MFRSERFVVTLKVDDVCFKLLQFSFARNDGSLYVSFPYFEHSEGIVAEAYLPNSPSGQIPLENFGKVTSHLVKYSHHPDGRAHFSQDGKVRTEVRKQALPINEIEGHTFTLQIQGLEAFTQTSAEEIKKFPQEKRQHLEFAARGQPPAAVRIVGRWHSQAEVIRQHKFLGGNAKEIPSAVIGKDSDGKHFQMLACSNLEGRPGDDRTLLITLVPMEPYAGEGETSMIFFGGFDDPAIVHDHSKDSTFLGFSYPVNDLDDLIKRVGSIDFVR